MNNDLTSLTSNHEQKFLDLDENINDLRVSYTLTREDYAQIKENAEWSNHDHRKSIQMMHETNAERDERITNMEDKLIAIEDTQQVLLNRLAIHENEVDSLADEVRYSGLKLSKSQGSCNFLTNEKGSKKKKTKNNEFHNKSDDDKYREKVLKERRKSMLLDPDGSDGGSSSSSSSDYGRKGVEVVNQKNQIKILFSSRSRSGSSSDESEETNYRKRTNHKFKMAVTK